MAINNGSYLSLLLPIGEKCAATHLSKAGGVQGGCEGWHDHLCPHGRFVQEVKERSGAGLPASTGGGQVCNVQQTFPCLVLYCADHCLKYNTFPQPKACELHANTTRHQMSSGVADNKEGCKTVWKM